MGRLTPNEPLCRYSSPSNQPNQMTAIRPWWSTEQLCHLYAGKEPPRCVCLIIPRHAPLCSALNLIILKSLSLRQVPHTVLFSPGEFARLCRLCAEDTWHYKVWKAFKSPAFPFAPACRPDYPFRQRWHSGAELWQVALCHHYSGATPTQ